MYGILKVIILKGERKMIVIPGLTIVKRIIVVLRLITVDIVIESNYYLQ